MKLGESTLNIDGSAEAAVAGEKGKVTVGFRPEALQVGDGPLRAQIRTVEDLGSEVFVHVGVKHHGENVSLVSKMTPPFRGQPGDGIGLQITGTTHLFASDGSRVATTAASLG